jgi:tetratricopeptide (TPR) repeat protein
MNFSVIAQDRKIVRQEQKAFLKALHYTELDDYEKAIEIFSSIVNQSPTFIEAYLHLGLCYLNTNKGADAAINALQNGLSRLNAEEQAAPLGQDFFMALGEAYQISLKPDSALLVYEVLLSKVDAEDIAFIQEIEQEMHNCENAKVFLANPIQLTIKNLGEAVNSKYDDHSPLVNVFEDMLLFTSRRRESRLPELADGQYPEKVYASVNNKQHWEKAELLNVFFKNPVHESALSLSADGKSLFVYRSDNEGKSIYMSFLENDKWSNPVKLPYPINTPANETHASLSSDRSTLFFTSDREGGYGGTDIYMCKKDAYGNWGKARNLGSSINTKYDEETAMIHPDGHTLYFASEGHNSMGRLDVFYAQMNPDSTWSLPVNLGYPINTPDDDFFFLPSLDKSHAYYASSRFDDNYGGSDIYKVEFEAGFEGELAVIEGQVNSADMANGPIRIMVTRMTDRQLVGDYRPDEKSGKYTMFLETGHDYAIEEKAIDKTLGEAVMTVKPSMAYENTTKVYTFSELEMTPPLKRRIVAKTLAEQNKLAVAAIEQEIKQIKVSPYFTIQVLALKRMPVFAPLYLKGLDAEDIQTIKCKDGFTRYLYGVYADHHTARKRQSEIRQLNKFEDSFIRALSELDVLKVD